MTSRTVVTAIALAIAWPTAARADPPVALTVTAADGTAAILADDGPAPTAPGPRRNAIYVEVLGKGGMWGVGYDRLVASRLALGAAASFMPHGDERVYTVAPYAAVYPWPRPRHRWLVQVGATIAHLERRSPVPEWPGTHSTGVGATLGTGYEYRGRLLLRAYALATVGRGGVAPWLGFSIGTTL